jgi:hypothetical protein
MSVMAKRLRIVVYPETRRTWTARVLEHDMSAVARSVELATDAVLKIAIAHIEFDCRHRREPLSVFSAAPSLYWVAFHSARPRPVSVEVPPPAGSLTRVYAEAVVLAHRPYLWSRRALADAAREAAGTLRDVALAVS